MANTSANCHCPCGDVGFTVSGAPLLRAFCHCTICQAFNEAPYADITLFRPSDVEMPESGKVAYKALRAPPAAQRGTCSACGKPAIEFLPFLGAPRLIFVPTGNIEDATRVPGPSLHIFYDSRVADVGDGLPKFSGYWRSQLAFWHRVLGGLRKA